MEFTLGDILAVLALGLSGIATWRTIKFRSYAKKVLDVQKEVTALRIEREKREALEAQRANLGARFISIGTKKHRLRIFNKGRAAAHAVTIEFPEGNNVIVESDLDAKFPFEVMEPGQSVDLMAAVVGETPRKHLVRLSWRNAEGEQREKDVHPTL